MPPGRKFRRLRRLESPQAAAAAAAASPDSLPASSPDDDLLDLVVGRPRPAPPPAPLPPSPVVPAGPPPAPAPAPAAALAPAPPPAPAAAPARKRPRPPPRAARRTARDPHCQRCTYLNAPAAAACAMCGAALQRAACASPVEEVAVFESPRSPMSSSGSSVGSDDDSDFEAPRLPVASQPSKAKGKAPAKPKGKAPAKKKPRKQQPTLSFAVAASPRAPRPASQPPPAAAPAPAPPPTPQPEPAQPGANGQPWTDRHPPASSADLVVSKKKVAELSGWLANALAGRPPRLLVLLGPPGCGKSAAVRVLAAEAGLAVRAWSDDYGTVPYQAAAAREEFSPAYESQLAGLRDFLRRAGAYRALDDPRPHLVLIEDLPASAARSAEARAALGTALADFAASTRFPAVLVFSDASASGKAPRSYELERLVGADLLASPGVAAMSVNAAPVGATKKRLAGIAAAERAPASAALVAAVAESAHGDLRHAINALQFACVGVAAGKPKRKGKGKGKPQEKQQAQQTKDRFRTSVHAVGKLLTLTPQKGLGRPAEVVAGSGMDAEYVAQFVAHNCPAYFTDVGELTGAVCALSDADAFCAPQFFVRRDDVFPAAYAQELVGRAVGTHNATPAPFTFRAVTRPAGLEARKRRERMRAEFRRLAVAHGTRCGVSEAVVATDVLPFYAAMRRAHAPPEPMLQELGASWTLSELPEDFGGGMLGGGMLEGLEGLEELLGSGGGGSGSGSGSGAAAVAGGAEGGEPEDEIEDSD